MCELLTIFRSCQISTQIIFKGQVIPLLVPDPDTVLLEIETVRRHCDEVENAIRAGSSVRKGKSASNGDLPHVNQVDVQEYVAPRRPTHIPTPASPRSIHAAGKARRPSTFSPPTDTRAEPAPPSSPLAQPFIPVSRESFRAGETYTVIQDSGSQTGPRTNNNPEDLMVVRRGDLVQAMFLMQDGDCVAGINMTTNTQGYCPLGLLGERNPAYKTEAFTGAAAPPTAVAPSAPLAAPLAPPLANAASTASLNGSQVQRTQLPEQPHPQQRLYRQQVSHQQPPSPVLGPGAYVAIRSYHRTPTSIHDGLELPLTAGDLVEIQELVPPGSSFNPSNNNGGSSGNYQAPLLGYGFKQATGEHGLFQMSCLRPLAPANPLTKTRPTQITSTPVSHPSSSSTLDLHGRLSRSSSNASLSSRAPASTENSALASAQATAQHHHQPEPVDALPVLARHESRNQLRIQPQQPQQPLPFYQQKQQPGAFSIQREPDFTASPTVLSQSTNPALFPPAGDAGRVIPAIPNAGPTPGIGGPFLTIASDTLAVYEDLYKTIMANRKKAEEQPSMALRVAEIKQYTQETLARTLQRSRKDVEASLRKNAEPSTSSPELPEVEEEIVFPPASETSRRNHAIALEVVRELYTSEENYLKDLKVFGELFINPIKSEPFSTPSSNSSSGGAAEPLITPYDQKTLFIAVPEITGLSEYVHEGLKVAVECFDADPFACANVFLDRLGKQTLIKYLQRADPRGDMFRKLLQKIEAQVPDRKNLDHFLMLPIMRISKYWLLLERLAKYSDKDHPKYDALRVAQEFMFTLGGILDARQRKWDSFVRMFAAKSEIQGFPDDLISSAREHVAEFETDSAKCTKRFRDSPRTKILIFSDCMVLARPISSSGWGSGIGSGSGGADGGAGTGGAASAFGSLSAMAGRGSGASHKHLMTSYIKDVSVVEEDDSANAPSCCVAKFLVYDSEVTDQD
ncbi:Protein T2 [Quaeritorhiza haematococci]|nr:Protein T2 [Quaeritorhiza haematococci]